MQAYKHRSKYNDKKMENTFEITLNNENILKVTYDNFILKPVSNSKRKTSEKSKITEFNIFK